MFPMRKKDLALVAFACGLLAFELVGLHTAAPAVMRTLAGVTGASGVRAASRSARTATESMVNGFSVAAAQAAVGAMEGAASRVGVASPITVGHFAAAPAKATARPAFGYVMVVRSGCRAAKRADTQVVTWRSDVTRAQVREITAQRRSECVQRRAQAAARRAESVRRAIEVPSEGSSL